MVERDAPARSPNLYGRNVHTISNAESVRVSPCPVCDAVEARPKFEVDGVASRVVVCHDCGLGRYHPMPGIEEIRSYYPIAYYGQPGAKFRGPIERLVRLVGRRHITFLSQGLAPRARVLDVGCGRGVLLGALADQGFRVDGVELSKEAAQGADPRAEIRIVPDLAEAKYPEASFDQVIIWHVLEHLADPRNTLEECRRMLRPGGRLIVAVPNFSSIQARWGGPDWFHLDAPRHLYHFPLPALRRLIDRCGFELSSEHHFSLRQNPFGWIQSALNRLPGLPCNGFYTVLHQRDGNDPPPFDLRLRLWMWTVFLLATPVACGLSLLEAILRNGATVHVVAVRR